MTTWSAAFASALRDGVLKVPDIGGGVVLVEKKPTPPMERTIIGLPPGAAVVPLGSVDHPGWVRKGRYRRKCDFVIFTEWGGRDYALLVEMKRTISGEMHALDQLVMSRPIVRYLEALGTLAGAGNGRVELRHVLLGERLGKHLDKRRVKSVRGKPVIRTTHRETWIAGFLDRELPLAAALGGDVAPGP